MGGELSRVRKYLPAEKLDHYSESFFCSPSKSLGVASLGSVDCQTQFELGTE